MTLTPPLKSPANDSKWAPSTSPAIFHQQSPPRIPVDFSPPLIAMVVVVAAAFVIVTYFRLISRHLLPPIIHLLRRWRLRYRLWRHHHRPSTVGDIESPPYDSSTFESTAFHYNLSPYGLDDTVIKTIPLSIYSKQPELLNKKSIDDCAVCLLEFEEHDYIRTLPACSHAFHVDCIDIWLRSHANCPLCRAGIFRPESPFIPLMASRIRPRFDPADDYILEHILSESRNEVVSIVPDDEETVQVLDQIGHDFDHRDLRSSPVGESTDLHDGRNFLLKRSYSFGFERNLASDRLITEPATASPWRYSRRRNSFWSKHASPFITKPRVFSLRGMKSPFFRRSSRGSSSFFFPLSESNNRYSSSIGGGGGGGGYSRRSKSMTSPFFMRSSTPTTTVMFSSSSRLRCGDPEALLSPERLNRR